MFGVPKLDTIQPGVPTKLFRELSYGLSEAENIFYW
jgi:hypothetical protein